MDCFDEPFSSQSRSRVAHLKTQFQNLHQGLKTCSEYLKSAKAWAYQLATIGKPIEDEDLISLIVSGLNLSFNAFITSFSFATRENPLTFNDFQDELLSHEMLLTQQYAAIDTTAIALVAQKPSNRPFQ